MSEIEKMYENAGVIKKRGCEYNNESCERQDFIPCNLCAIQKEMIYPSFTAEKQLEIAKFLLKKAVYYDVKDNKYWFYYEECESAGYKPFDEAIAHFINKLWTDLTEEEKMSIKNILKKQQVKGILE